MDLLSSCSIFIRDAPPRRRQKPPQTCECGRAITIRVHPRRNPRSAYAGKGTQAGRLKDHDLCARCFGAIVRRSQEAEMRPLGSG